MAEVDSVVGWEKKYEDSDGVCPLKHSSRFAPLEVLFLFPEFRESSNYYNETDKS
jgi:hypothetical protein